MLLSLASKGQVYNTARVDFVGNRYLDVLIKGIERQRRAAGKTERLEIYSCQQKLPTQWKKFLNCGVNKETLLKFLCEQWKKATLPHQFVLYCTMASQCFKLQFEQDQPPIVSIVLVLDSDHEEADTWLHLHAAHAAKDKLPVIIESPDTDMAVLALHFSPCLPNLFISRGTRKGH